MTRGRGHSVGDGRGEQAHAHGALPGDATFPAATGSPSFKQVFEGEERQSPSHKYLIGN